ncbi:MAG TPA: hypothetical protein VM598_12710 [Bdellovibrionota bacterium]|nr:hypothetical protein [Bdellovibrionota bacterium]
MQQERIGDFLREKGVITEEEIGLILSYSKQTGLKFCQAGLEMKVLTQDKLVKAFAPGFKGDFFNVSALHLPKNSIDLLSVEDVILHGAIPLGCRKETRILGPSRRKVLNLGLLDPAKHGVVVDAIYSRGEWKRRRKPFHSTNVYLVLVDQFLEVLDKVYGVKEEQIRKMDPTLVEPTLRRFLRVGAEDEKLPLKIAA